MVAAKLAICKGTTKFSPSPMAPKKQTTLPFGRSASSSSRPESASGEAADRADDEAEDDAASAAGSASTAKRTRTAWSWVWEFFDGVDGNTQCKRCWENMTEEQRNRPTSERLGAAKGFGLLPKQTTTNMTIDLFGVGQNREQRRRVNLSRFIDNQSIGPSESID